MSEEPIEKTEPVWYGGPAFLLLVTLMGTYAVGTFLGTRGYGAHLVNVLLMFSLFFGVKKITRSRKALKFTIAIALVGFLGNTTANVLLERDAYYFDSLTSLVFFAAILGLLMWAVLKADRVNADTVFAASCVYILIGIVFAYGFLLIHLADPTAFSLTADDIERAGGALLHFSFTTLTTVGYGSISPMSEIARMLSDLEAVIAQLYLAVVIARLVSLQIAHSSGSAEE